MRFFLWSGYAITMFLGMFTHYFFSLAMLTEGLYILIYRKGIRSEVKKGVAIMSVVYAASFTPWLLYVLRSGLLSNTTPHLSRPTALDVFNSFSQFIFGFQDTKVNTILLSTWPIVVLFIFLALQRNTRIGPTARYFIFTSAVPVAITFLLSISLQPFFLSRYLIVAIPSLFLIITILFFAYPKRLSLLMRGAFIGAMASALLVEAVSASSPAKESYKSVSDYLQANASAEDVVIVSAPFTIYPIEYYYKGNADIVTLPVWNRFESGSIPPFSNKTLPAEAGSIEGDHVNAWLVLSYDQGYETQIRTYFETHYAELDKRTLSDNLTLYKFRLRYDVSTL